MTIRIQDIKYPAITSKISLMSAITTNNIKDINTILHDRVIPLYLTAADKKPMLTYAIEEGAKANTVEALLKNGFKTNTHARIDTEKKFDTPLMAAARLGKNDIAKVLLEYNAKIYTKNKNEQTAFDIALNKKHFDVAEGIIKNGAMDPNHIKFSLAATFIGAGLAVSAFVLAVGIPLALDSSNKCNSVNIISS